MDGDAEFLGRVEAGTWPIGLWDHRAHIRLAYAVLRLPLNENGIDRIKNAIKAHNSAHEVPEGIDRGFHETVTIAWCRLVGAAIQDHDPGSFPAFCRAHPHLLDRATLRRHYSRERIMTVRAKAEFVEPDLLPFDTV